MSFREEARRHPVLYSFALASAAEAVALYGFDLFGAAGVAWRLLVAFGVFAGSGLLALLLIRLMGGSP